MTIFKRFFLFLPMLLVALVGATSAGAAVASPGWTVDTLASPSVLSEEDNGKCFASQKTNQLLCDGYVVTATNAGSEPTNGSPVTLTDTLAPGLTVRSVELTTSQLPQGDNAVGSCGGEALAGGGVREHCTFPGTVEGQPLPPDGRLTMSIDLTVGEEVTGPFANVAGVSGGGAPGVSSPEISTPTGSSPAPFGASSFDFFIGAQNGTRDAQAGDHPYELTTTFGLNNDFRVGSGGSVVATSVEDLKDVVVDLPLGFVGSTLSAPECTLAQLSAPSKVAEHGSPAEAEAIGGCPPNTVVGHIYTEGKPNSTGADGPIYNMVPERGAPAEFGYIDALKGAHVFYTHVVPTPAGYVLQVTAADIPQIGLKQIITTFYGDPAARDSSGGAPVPFFTNPTDCAGGPLVSTVYMDSWQHPGSYNADGTPDLEDPAWVSKQSVSPPVTGCNALQFTPELGAQPTTHAADTPSGLEFETKIPQTETVGTNATPALKNLTVRFPQGMTVDPSSADGLGVCSEAQIGWQGPTLFDFTPGKPECPESSKIGSLELETPLIPEKIVGEVFLASQNANPFHSTFAIYVVVNDPITGVVLKIAGELKADPVTGQLTSVFEQNPQLPFSDLKVHFFEGPRAELATPPGCGIYTTQSEMEPWSAPDSGPIGTPFDNYTIDENCAIGFAPAFTGGASNLQAGAYTPFVGSIERQDNDQELGGLTMNLPPGLLANVASVPLCGEAQANAGTCPQSTQVGTVEAGAGPGPNPLFVPGKIYLTGPYNGGPYGLSVVVPADPGPFNFGLVVVRQSLRIDPLTAAVTDVSDPFPTILDPVGANGQTTGIPIKLRRIDFDIDRPGFTFNPTSCAKLQVGGAITSIHGATSSLADPFQVTNCQSLKFQPKFAVSTSGKTSKADGASLTATVTEPAGAPGSEANIGKVKVELPSALPSRLTTLQKACTAKQFESNPAGCPAESVIGHAVVHTPILPAALEGPAYFVSNGSEAFPNLIIVLQGDNVTIHLVGDTLIKNGVTSTTFKAVPDTPFETFSLTLPEGKYSALAANANLCKPTVSKTVKKQVRVQVKGKLRTVTRKVKEQVAAPLQMPNEFIGQNGAEIHQVTPIAVTGCPKTKPAVKKKQKRSKQHKSAKRGH
jgi:hypothetical protein